MLTRVVKMTFKQENISRFQKMFFEKQHQIRNFEGCNQVDLLQDLNDPRIFFTYSTWDNNEALENYRHSAFFRETWAETKNLFGAPAEAWSLMKRLPAL